jgi:hypothetical protein
MAALQFDLEGFQVGELNATAPASGKSAMRPKSSVWRSWAKRRLSDREPPPTPGTAPEIPPWPNDFHVGRPLKQESTFSDSASLQSWQFPCTFGRPLSFIIPK